MVRAFPPSKEMLISEYFMSFWTLSTTKKVRWSHIFMHCESEVHGNGSWGRFISIFIYILHKNIVIIQSEMC